MIKLFKKGPGLCPVNFFTRHKPCPLKNGFMPPNAFYWLGNNDKWPMALIPMKEIVTYL